MRARRNLALRKETLTELETTELASVVGGPDSPISDIVCFEIAAPSQQIRICNDSVLRGCTYRC